MIDHKESHIRIETTTTSEAGKAPSTQDFTTNGDATVNKMQVMDEGERVASGAICTGTR